MKVINQTTGEKCDREYVIRAAVAYIDGIVEFGYCSKDDPNLIPCNIVFEDYRCTRVIKNENLFKHVIYSNYRGCYLFVDKLDQQQILTETLTYGRGGFPYTFEREYEAVNCFDIFKNKQKIIDAKEYPLSNYLKYTFGAEFETYSGYIPQDICFRDGLIPLRDGSLEGGIEYSTVVLQGNDGLNLLHQQIETLKKYTYFNKECSLHFHFGNYPVSSKHIWALYLVWQYITPELGQYLPAYSFTTSEYKSSGKDYCKHLPKFSSFGQLYSYLAGQRYFGSLTQCHPADPGKKAKWNIHSRYSSLNLVNMVCYKSPKTVEFRFLRPTFNYHKILLWLYIFNAILIYSESIANSVEDIDDVAKKIRLRGVTLERIILTVYPGDVSEILLKDLTLLSIVASNQNRIQDFIGATTEIENSIIDPNIII